MINFSYEYYLSTKEYRKKIRFQFSCAECGKTFSYADAFSGIQKTKKLEGTFLHHFTECVIMFLSMLMHYHESERWIEGLWQL